jgi:hypothetical protein
MANHYNSHRLTPEDVSMSLGKDSSLFLLVTAFAHLNFVYLLYIFTMWHPSAHNSISAALPDRNF